jgi:hypothetical protein
VLQGGEYFSIHFSDQSVQLFRARDPSHSVRDFAIALASIIQRHYGIAIPTVTECALEEIVKEPTTLDAADRLFGIPIRKWQKRTNSVCELYSTITTTTTTKRQRVEAVSD